MYFAPHEVDLSRDDSVPRLLYGLPLLAPGQFYTQLGRVVLEYRNWPTPQGGPTFSTDTLFATKSGGYVLHEEGLTLVY